MEKQPYIFSKIASVLHSIGTKACMERAANLVKESRHSNSLHLRSLDLRPADALLLAAALREVEEQVAARLYSLSFSYNKSLKDDGAIALIEALPPSLHELGMVGCGMGDRAGKALLHWMRDASHLRMVCVEQNAFSNEVRQDFFRFNRESPQPMVVVYT